MVAQTRTRRPWRRGGEVGRPIRAALQGTSEPGGARRSHGRDAAGLERRPRRYQKSEQARRVWARAATDAAATGVILRPAGARTASSPRERPSRSLGPRRLPPRPGVWAVGGDAIARRLKSGSRRTRAVREHPAQGVQEPDGSRRARPRRRRRRRRVGLVVQDLADELAADPARPDLDEEARAVLVHPLDLVHEADGMAEVCAQDLPHLRVALRDTARPGGWSRRGSGPAGAEQLGSAPSNSLAAFATNGNGSRNPRGSAWTRSPARASGPAGRRGRRGVPDTTVCRGALKLATKISFSSRIAAPRPSRGRPGSPSWSRCRSPAARSMHEPRVQSTSYSDSPRGRPRSRTARRTPPRCGPRPCPAGLRTRAGLVESEPGGTQGRLGDVGTRQRLHAAPPGPSSVNGGRRIHVLAERQRQTRGQHPIRDREALPQLAEEQGEVLQHVHALGALPGEDERDLAAPAAAPRDRNRSPSGSRSGPAPAQGRAAPAPASRAGRPRNPPRWPARRPPAVAPRSRPSGTRGWARSRSAAGSSAARRISSTSFPQTLQRRAAEAEQLRGEAARSGRRKTATCSVRCSSTTAWKFVPPNPNELTPARRGWSRPTQGRTSALR